MSTHEPGSTEAITADIEQQRDHLARTVDALHAKLDVKSQAQAKVAEVKDRATTDTGAPRPEVIAAAAAVLAVVIFLIWHRRR
ncbi:MAG: DUF3618 domain-containing protein [Actinomycetota bacterium]|nr:DUF3618 domain-containing protein [Actinomycetota bacterium]